MPKIENGNLVSDPERDILKMVVLSRYSDDPVRIGFIKNIGLEKGAIASSIAHDSHNIIAVGATDEDIVETVNRLIKIKEASLSGQQKTFLTSRLRLRAL